MGISIHEVFQETLEKIASRQARYTNRVVQGDNDFVSRVVACGDSNENFGDFSNVCSLLIG